MKIKCFLIRDVLLHYGPQAVRVTEDCEAEIDFPDGVDVTRGVFQDKATRGEWRIARVSGEAKT